MVSKLAKAIEKFKAHELSNTHAEAKMNWIARGKLLLLLVVSSQLAKSKN